MEEPKDLLIKEEYESNENSFNQGSSDKNLICKEKVIFN